MVGATGIEPVTPTMSRLDALDVSLSRYLAFFFHPRKLPTHCPGYLSFRMACLRCAALTAA
jgi:hypothetical protein